MASKWIPGSMSGADTSAVFLTSRELATRWHTSPGRLANDRSARKDHPPFVRIGVSIRYRLSDVERWEERHEDGAELLDNRRNTRIVANPVRA